MVTSSAALLVALLAGAAPVPAAADPSPAGSPATLRYRWEVDGGIVLATGGGWIASELLKSSLAPEHCRWCATNRLDTSVSRALRWSNPSAANTLGGIAAYVLAPLTALGGLALAARPGDGQTLPADVLVVLEAVTVSSAVNQAVKFTVGRERPFVAGLPAASRPAARDPADDNLSFYSGHTNLAFALAVSAGTVAHLRGYRGEGLIWATGLPLAAFVGYSRIAADKHYLTDVLVGAAAGSAFGFLLPWYFHGPQPSDSMQLAPTLGGLSVSGTF